MSLKKLIALGAGKQLAEIKIMMRYAWVCLFLFASNVQAGDVCSTLFATEPVVSGFADELAFVRNGDAVVVDRHLGIRHRIFGRDYEGVANVAGVAIPLYKFFGGGTSDVYLGRYKDRWVGVKIFKRGTIAGDGFYFQHEMNVLRDHGAENRNEVLAKKGSPLRIPKLILAEDPSGKFQDRCRVRVA